MTDTTDRRERPTGAWAMTELRDAIRNEIAAANDETWENRDQIEARVDRVLTALDAGRWVALSDAQRDDIRQVCDMASWGVASQANRVEASILRRHHDRITRVRALAEGSEP